MTDSTRLAALEAVAEAALDFMNQASAEFVFSPGCMRLQDRLEDRLAALDALPRPTLDAAPENTVEVKVAVRMNTSGRYVAFGDSADPKYADAALEWVDGSEFPHIATLVAHVAVPTIPVVEAEVRL